MPDSLLSTRLADSPLALIDHHVHGAVAGPLDGPGIESLLTESVLPAPPGTTAWDTPLGFASAAGARRCSTWSRPPRPPSTWPGAPSWARPR